MSYSNAKLNAQEQFHLWLYLVTSGPDAPNTDLKNYYLIKFPEAGVLNKQKGFTCKKVLEINSQPLICLKI